MMTLKKRKNCGWKNTWVFKIIDIIFKVITVNGSYLGIEQTLDKVMIQDCQ